MVFKLFSTSCKYRAVCNGYDSGSYACSRGKDKEYCGLYRRFVDGGRVR